MKHILFKENPNNEYEIALLIKETSFTKDELQRHYINPLLSHSISEASILALSLSYEDTGKVSAKHKKEYLGNLLKATDTLKITTLLVADSTYFKSLTGVTKIEPNHGYILPCKIKGYEHINCILSVNYQGLFYNPELQTKIDLSLETLAGHINGSYKELGADIIKYGYYPDKTESIKQAINSLHAYPELTCDVETFSLKHYDSGIGTISFAWDENNGIAFTVDYRQYTTPTDIEVWCDKDNKYKTKLAYGYQETNDEVRELLREFFETYTGKLKYHNASFDVYILIYQLWMKDITDHAGLYTGLDILTKNFDCTQIITYLATNTCAGNQLGLKAQSHLFAGAYAENDIDDIRLIPKDKLLKYNLIDSAATWYTYNKNYPVLIQDQQEKLYLGLMKESLITIIQMQLTGMPICMTEVKKAKKELQNVYDKHFNSIMNSSFISKATELLKLKFLDKDFLDRKNKAKKPENIEPKLLENIPWEFNPNSGTQIAVLVHEVMQLPIIETTKTGLPATDEDTLKSLINHTNNQTYKTIIQDILGLGKVSKILSTFIPAFEKAQLGKDGIYYLFGSFKLGGTISGRLSSSNPNLQNLPSGSDYGKIIKRCFRGNTNWLFGGADFSSLEDRINALLTKDTNKIKVYIDGYDGHSLRAFSYFTDQMPDIKLIDEKEHAFKVKIGVDTHYIKCGTLVTCPRRGNILIEDYLDDMENVKRIP